MATNQSQYEEMCEVYERYNKGDLVPVVRCKDCIHRFKDGENVVFNCCELNHNIAQADDWFCADGVRREDGTND